MTLQLIDKIKKIPIYIILLFFLSTTYNSQLAKNLNEIFKIKKVEIKNNLYKQEFSNLIDQNIFKINKKHIMNNIIKFPILEKFKINKIYPNTISISLIETKILAKFYIKEDLFYIGANGNIFKIKNDNHKVLLIEGNYNLNKFNLFLKNIMISNLNFDSIEKLIFYPSYRWDVVFENKTILKLPNKELQKNLQTAEILLQKDEFKGKVIDLRINNKVIVSNE
ncbi:cell division protein FtsQ/DivIB [Pelagibacterales bacterium SAG-MED15]|nr:cell division protein FtsQ/DivIB [Pelagibacterales bacterium SAG-MED15]